MTPVASGKKPPARVVCLAPAYTEVCFALGEGARVVGVSDFCTFPEPARKLPSVGGVVNPNPEKVLSLLPDVVFMPPEQSYMAEQLCTLGIRTVVVPMVDIGGLMSGIGRISAELGVPEKGGALIKRLQDSLRADGRPPVARPRVLLVVGRDAGALSGIYVAGRGTFLGEILERAGGSNAYEGPLLYPAMSVEGVLATAPDVVLELRPGEALDAAAKRDMASQWSSLPHLPAAKTGKIYVLDEDFLSIPGPRAAQTAAIFRRCLE